MPYDATNLGITPAELLREMGACTDAVAWARQYDTAAAAWAACQNGDWMVWYLVHACAPPDITSLLLDRLDYCDSASALRLIRSQFPTPPPPNMRRLREAK